MGRLGVLLLPLLAACGFAAAKAHAPEATTVEAPRDIMGVLHGENFARSMGARVVPLTADPFAPVAAREGEVKVYDLREQTFHTNVTAPGASVAEPASKTASAPPPEAPPGRTHVQEERAVIYTGSLALQVPDPEGLEVEVGGMAKQFGGWVSKIERPRIVVRVPAARFDEAMKAFSALGQILDRKISGQDVTDQYRDLRIRLENAEKVRVRLAALLEQAKNVQDALAVEKELGRVTEEIERLKGQIAAMQDQVAFSTITLELRRSLPISVRHRRFPFPWVHRLGAEQLLRF